MVLRGDDGKRWDGGKKEVAIRRSLESRPNQFGVPPGTISIPAGVPWDAGREARSRLSSLKLTTHQVAEIPPSGPQGHLALLI